MQSHLSEVPQAGLPPPGRSSPCHQRTAAPVLLRISGNDGAPAVAGTNLRNFYTANTTAGLFEVTQLYPLGHTVWHFNFHFHVRAMIDIGLEGFVCDVGSPLDVILHCMCDTKPGPCKSTVALDVCVAQVDMRLNRNNQNKNIKQSTLSFFDKSMFMKAVSCHKS